MEVQDQGSRIVRFWWGFSPWEWHRWHRWHSDIDGIEKEMKIGRGALSFFILILRVLPSWPYINLSLVSQSPHLQLASCWQLGLKCRKFMRMQLIPLKSSFHWFLPCILASGDSKWKTLLRTSAYSFLGT